jgi:uncharacterized protein YndB with AHSA1/START domain
MKNDLIMVERTLKASSEKIWKAITDKSEMRKWYFDISDFHPKTDFEFRFEAGPEHKKYVHLCRITEVIPIKKLSYTWAYEGYTGDSMVTFDLIPGGATEKEELTIVRLTHEGVESFPAQADFAHESFVEGWNEIIGKSLRDFVERK